MQPIETVACRLIEEKGHVGAVVLNLTGYVVPVCRTNAFGVLLKRPASGRRRPGNLYTRESGLESNRERRYYRLMPNRKMQRLPATSVIEPATRVNIISDQGNGVNRVIYPTVHWQPILTFPLSDRSAPICFDLEGCITPINHQITTVTALVQCQA